LTVYPDRVGVGLRIVLRETSCPLDVGDERRTELRVVEKAGVVGGQAHQRSEAESLLGRDCQVVVR
jgi:hypothetical protein